MGRRVDRRGQRLHPGTQLWSTPIQGGATPVAAADGKVFAAADSTKDLVALDAALGTPLWTATNGYANGGRSPYNKVAVAGGVLFAPGGWLDENTGSLLSDSFLGQSYTIAGGRVYVTDELGNSVANYGFPE